MSTNAERNTKPILPIILSGCQRQDVTDRAREMSYPFRETFSRSSASDWLNKGLELPLRSFLAPRSQGLTGSVRLFSGCVMICRPDAAWLVANSPSVFIHVTTALFQQSPRDGVYFTDYGKGNREVVQRTKYTWQNHRVGDD